MTIIISGRGFSTAEDTNLALNVLMNAMAAAIYHSYPERFK